MIMVLSSYDDHHCQHRSDDFPLIERVIRAHAPEIIVELGTDEGGFAAFLADLARDWNGVVYTVDRERKFHPSLLDRANLTFLHLDVLDHARSEIRDLLSRPRVLLYCDNGHKEREIMLYAPHLQIGSLLACHDYGTEVRPSWVEAHVNLLGFVTHHHEDFAALANEWYPHSLTRFWLRTS
jgi:cephalosporin hydroxylase